MDIGAHHGKYSLELAGSLFYLYQHSRKRLLQCLRDACAISGFGDITLGGPTNQKGMIPQVFSKLWMFCDFPQLPQ